MQYVYRVELLFYIKDNFYIKGCSNALLYKTCDHKAFSIFVNCDFDIRTWREKEEIWLSPMTKDPIPKENPKTQHDKLKTPTKRSITQRMLTTYNGQ